MGAPTLFYSRRIGLDNGPRDADLVGGRVTGKVGKFRVGALNIETDEQSVGYAPQDELHGAARASATSCGAA